MRRADLREMENVSFRNCGDEFSGGQEAMVREVISIVIVLSGMVTAVGEEIVFNRENRPILSENCHGPTEQGQA